MDYINGVAGEGFSMSEQQFEFVPGPNLQSLRIIFRGFWDEAVMQRYVEALRQRKISVGGASPVTRVLLDMKACSIQSQAVLNSMRKVIDSYAAQIEHYGMILPESALLRLQMKRLMANTSTSVFDDDGEASAWLSS